jgi:hypothetical protein
MCDGMCSACAAPGAISFLRDRRKVVGVNEIMGDAGMVRMLGKLSVEDRSRLQRARIALVVQRLACGEVDGAEDLCLVVILVTGGQSFKCIRERAHARCLRPLGEAIVKGSDRLDIIAFPLRLGANRAPAFDRRNGARGVFRRGPERKRIADQGRCYSPGGDGAGWVAVKRIAEGLFAGRESEGMQKRDSALETSLCVGRAGIGKRDSAEPLAGRVAHGRSSHWAGGHRAERRGNSKNNGKKQSAAHRSSLLRVGRY